jgi:hypothetical protein
MNAWLFTNTYYGTWLPGDERGSVTSVRQRRAEDPSSEFRVEHDRLGTPVEGSMPSLRRSAIERMKGPPIYFDEQKAKILLAQLKETSSQRGWILRYASIMRNHAHWIALIPYELTEAKALADYKAYGSRALNREFGVPQSGTWWTSKGSKRLLTDDASLSAALHYVLHQQPGSLISWSDDPKP